MINHQPTRFDSGIESIPEGSHPLNPLFDALKADASSSIRDELARLLRHAQAGQLSSADLLQTLLSQDAYGDSAWQEICKRTGVMTLGTLLEGISDLIAAGRLDPAEALTLFRASDDAQRPALHVLAFNANPRGLGEYGRHLMDLHARGRLPDTDVASVLLQAWNGETVVQRALLGGPDAIKVALGLLSAALKAGVITEGDVCDALGAGRFAGYDASGRPASTVDAPSPLHVVFMTATVPAIEAVLQGVEALRRTGGMSTERLLSVMEPAFRSTGSAVRMPSTTAMTKELAQANALVAQARERWSTAAPETTARR
jgi:hypothetical protein